MRSSIFYSFLALLIAQASLPATASDDVSAPQPATNNSPAAIRVAVAANFKSTLLRINKKFTAATGIEIKVSSASTGVLAQQILYGAPFDVFFSADEMTPIIVLSAEQKPQEDFFCYALGRLSLLGGDGSLTQLAQPTMSMAIANPATAPYGRAAQEVLERPEFSAAQARKLVRGNNAAQAYQFWFTGSVNLALIPLALAPETSASVPQEWHSPIEQYALVLQRNTAVDAYIKWVRSDTVRTLIQRAGYLTCH